MMADAAEDQLSYFIKDEQAFGKIVCSAKTLDENLLEGNPCEFEVVPKGNQNFFHRHHHVISIFFHFLEICIIVIFLSA